MPDEVRLMQVAHARNPNFGFPRPEAPDPVYPQDFEVVALVEVPPGQDADPDLAYQLTNHIDRSWWDNEGVTLVGKTEHRSTSVGDLVILPDGKILECNYHGWKERK